VATAAHSSALDRVPALDSEHRLLGGVAAGIAGGIGVAPIVVRAGFVVLAAAGGFGIVLYVAGWALMSWTGRGKGRGVPEEGLGPLDRVLASALVTVGLLLLVQGLGLGFGSSVSLPLMLVGLGLLVTWHRVGMGTLVTGRDAAARIALGFVLAGVGIAGLIALNVDLAAARDAVLLTAAVVGGLALVAAPAIAGLVHDLAAERRERIRSEERARVAAHLHDSVLQTLALIQRSGGDPARAAALARRQERELRAWLYGADRDRRAGTVRAVLEDVCAEVEQVHGIPVELVVVGGDALAGSRVVEAIGAMREAAINAARHSETDRIDVYAETGPDGLSVYVRDTGRGFAPEAVPNDRVGLRESVVARMERLGGTAVVTSSPGEGTEVELRLPEGI
jgi:signal transduction histidine kinase/phage shock protein PspC (stress-responsive transcriptional regulator)